MSEASDAAAYGGPGWSPRETPLQNELGTIWGMCGVNSEWSTLRSVLLHRPGRELGAARDPNAVQMLGPLDITRAGEQHDAIARAYETAGVIVHRVQPAESPTPNLMFVADLLFMTPEGAILGRPASTVRAGEERWIARRLGELGIPILRTVRGTGTFEGADAAWVDAQTALVATGLRTNTEGAAQVQSTLVEMGIEVIQVGLPFGAMHLMGTLRFLDHDLAIARRGRVPYAAVEALQRLGYQVLFAPNRAEVEGASALNFVTLGPRRILLAAGNPITQGYLEERGVICHTVEVNELIKAAGGIGCLTGILERDIEAE
jgi:arginine deiminase